MVDPLFAQALEIYKQENGDLKTVAEKLNISEQRAEKILATVIAYKHTTDRN